MPTKNVGIKLLVQNK